MVENAVLEHSKDLFTIPFQSGVDNIVTSIYQEDINGVMVANIPLIEVSFDDAGNRSQKFKAGKPHLLRITPGNIYSPDLRGFKPVHLANHYTAQMMIDDYYEKYLVNQMLKQAKVIEGEFLLEETDIQEYNTINNQTDCSGCFIPVYLQQTGKYCYVNKIDNFRNGRLTKCELIRL